MASLDNRLELIFDVEFGYEFIINWKTLSLFRILHIFLNNESISNAPINYILRHLINYYFTLIYQPSYLATDLSP